MMNRFACLLAVAVAGCATAADAAEQDSYSSWYAGIGINTTFPQGNKVSGASTGTIHYQASVTLPDVVFGYRPEALYNTTGDVRFELALLNRSFGLNKVSSGAGDRKPGGDLGVAALMTNVYYDIHTATSFTPFIGAGIGGAGARFSKNPGFSMTDM